VLRRLKRTIAGTPLLGRGYRGVRDARARRRFWQAEPGDAGRLAFYRQLVRPGTTVFDVGANLGNRTKVFLRLGARTVAFEPQPDLAAYLDLILGRDPRFRLVHAALGERPGQAEMLVSNMRAFSTLSPAWVEAAATSGRFPSGRWDERLTVEVITLDDAIREHGIPSFVKIDVEGFELEVVSGLSRPVEYLSLEFTSEGLERTYRCIDHVEALGPVVGQLSLAETMAFALPSWVPVAELKEALARIAEETELAWGDVYLHSAVTSGPDP
jgi:FkbM family methyltransferase